MRRLFDRGRRALLIAAAAAMAAGLFAGTAAHASAATVSSSPCSFNPVGTCQSTDGTVTENFQFLNASACTFAFRVAWDDGAVSNETVTDPADGYLPVAQHTYTKAGTYTIVITAQVVTGDCTVTALSGNSFTFAPPTPAPSPAACAPVWFIGARGSGETFGEAYVEPGGTPVSGMGKEVDYLGFEVRADLKAEGVAVHFGVVGYPADPVKDLLPSQAVVSLLAERTALSVTAATALYIHQSVDKYDASITQGIKQTESSVAAALKACPNAKLILAGYSQGAAAVHDAENWLKVHQPAEFNHIAGTLLLGDPDRVTNSKAHRIGSSPITGRGLRSYFGLVHGDVADPLTTAEITNQYDIAGDFGLNAPHLIAGYNVHTTYETTKNGMTLLASAATWVVSNVSAG